MAGNLLPGHLCEGSERIAIVRRALRRIVPFVDLFHELVSKLLCLALGRHIFLGPFLTAFLAGSGGVIPVIDSPLVPKCLYIYVLIPFSHQNPPRSHDRTGNSKIEKLQAAEGKVSL